jgi:CHRD domain
MNVTETFLAGIRVSMERGVNSPPIFFRRHATARCATSRHKFAQPPRRLGRALNRTPPLHAIHGLKFPAGPGVNARLEPHWEDTVKIALCLIAAIALLVGFPNGIPLARAETITLKADLKGANEVPPNASPATGKAEAKLNTETRVLTWTVTYADLTGPALGAHFHGPSEQGKNAGIVLPFKTVQNPIEGTATLTETQAADLLACKHPHPSQSRRRTARPDDEVTDYATCAACRTVASANALDGLISTNSSNFPNGSGGETR